MEPRFLLLFIASEVERKSKADEVGEVVNEGDLAKSDIEESDKGQKVGGENTAVDELEEGHELHGVDESP